MQQVHLLIVAECNVPNLVRPETYFRVAPYWFIFFVSCFIPFNNFQPYFSQVFVVSNPSALTTVTRHSSMKKEEKVGRQIQINQKSKIKGAFGVALSKGKKALIQDCVSIRSHLSSVTQLLLNQTQFEGKQLPLFVSLSIMQVEYKCMSFLFIFKIINISLFCQ